MTVLLKVKRARAGDFPVPAYQTSGAACFDLSADFGFPNNTATLHPGDVAWFCCGWCFEVPPGYEMQVRGRSGLAYRNVVVAHHLGTIDCDYRGEVQVALENRSDRPFTITHGMRIAQAKIAPVPVVRIEVVDELSDTARGVGGFGSTGLTQSHPKKEVAHGRETQRSTTDG